MGGGNGYCRLSRNKDSSPVIVYREIDGVPELDEDKIILVNSDTAIYISAERDVHFVRGEVLTKDYDPHKSPLSETQFNQLKKSVISRMRQAHDTSLEDFL